jgi:hypothetical protein
MFAVGQKTMSKKMPYAYANSHTKVGRIRGKASNFPCSNCGVENKAQWANLTGNYKDPEFQRRQFDQFV